MTLLLRDITRQYLAFTSAVFLLKYREVFFPVRSENRLRTQLRCERPMHGRALQNTVAKTGLLQRKTNVTTCTWAPYQPALLRR